MVSFYTIRSELGRSHQWEKLLTSLTFSQKLACPGVGRRCSPCTHGNLGSRSVKQPAPDGKHSLKDRFAAAFPLWCPCSWDPDPHFFLFSKKSQKKGEGKEEGRKEGKEKTFTRQS